MPISSYIYACREPEFNPLSISIYKNYRLLSTFNLKIFDYGVFVPSSVNPPRYNGYLRIYQHYSTASERRAGICLMVTIYSLYKTIRPGRMVNKPARLGGHHSTVRSRSLHVFLA